MKQKDTILEQEGGYTLANAPQVKPNPKFDFMKPQKDTVGKVKQLGKNIVSTAKKAADVAGGSLERAWSKGIDSVTEEEVDEEWVPYFLKTGNLKILNQKTKGKSKSFLVDLRSWGFMNPSIRNYFYNKIEDVKDEYPDHFRYISLLKENPPRSGPAALKLPDNVKKLNPKKSNWAKKAIKSKKIKKKKPWYKGLWDDTRQLGREVWGSLTQDLEETKVMNNDDIRKMIQEAFTDKVYGQYPYSHRTGDEEEPKEDYVEEWKRFCMEIVQDRSKEKAIALAKILIKDIELFEDVLDLAGQNQSIGSEILRKMEESTKNMV